MKQRKHLVLTLVIVMVAMIALSVNTALAGSDEDAPEEHPPVCYYLESFAPGVVQLECTDSGKDIVFVGVKSESKYQLDWDEDSVTLIVYPARRNAVTMWAVEDKAGNITTGRIP